VDGSNPSGGSSRGPGRIERESGVAFVLGRVNPCIAGGVDDDIGCTRPDELMGGPVV
jgi:hypothetical protein